MQILWGDGVAADADIPGIVAGLLNKKLRTIAAQQFRNLHAKMDEQNYRIFCESLVRLADQWIDSGITAKPSEIPSSRSGSWTSPAYPKSIAEMHREFWQHYELTRWVVEGGETVMKFQSRTRASWLSGTPTPVSPIPDPVIAKRCALYWIVRLLESEDRLRLFRCRWCRTYFAKKRNPKRGLEIRNGASCVKCRNRTSVHRVNTSRAVKRLRLLEAAARAYETWDESQKHRLGAKEDAMIAAVNRIPGTNFKKNWLTRNRREIDELIQRRKDAKG